MKRRKLFNLIIMLAVMCFGAQAYSQPSHYGQSNSGYNSIVGAPKGFNWYDDTNPLPPAREDDSKFPKASPKKLTEAEIVQQRIDTVAKNLQHAINKALDNPTLENVINAQKIQQYVINKTSNFAKMWQIASIGDHSLYNNDEHHNVLHRQIHQKVEGEQTAAKFNILSKDYGLLLQVHPSCPYSVHFAPIVKAFAQRYNFQLIAVSPKGEDFLGIEGMPEAGKLKQVNPEYKVPALYLFHRSGTKIYPVAWGIVDEDLITRNILALGHEYQELKR